jgi:hypothetical protein
MHGHVNLKYNNHITSNHICLSDTKIVITIEKAFSCHTVPYCAPYSLTIYNRNIFRSDKHLAVSPPVTFLRARTNICRSVFKESLNYWCRNTNEISKCIQTLMKLHNEQFHKNCFSDPGFDVYEHR